LTPPLEMAALGGGIPPGGSLAFFLLFLSSVFFFGLFVVKGEGENFTRGELTFGIFLAWGSPHLISQRVFLARGFFYWPAPKICNPAPSNGRGGGGLAPGPGKIVWLVVDFPWHFFVAPNMILLPLEGCYWARCLGGGGWGTGPGFYRGGGGNGGGGTGQGPKFHVLVTIKPHTGGTRFLGGKVAWDSLFGGWGPGAVQKGGGGGALDYFLGGHHLFGFRLFGFWKKKTF